MVHLKRKERLKNGLLKTGEIAKKAGVLPSCVRYYAKMGLLDIYGKTQGKYRLYNKKETLEKLHKIKRLKVEGASLKIIKKKIANKR